MYECVCLYVREGEREWEEGIEEESMGGRCKGKDSRGRPGKGKEIQSKREREGK